MDERYGNAKISTLRRDVNEMRDSTRAEGTPRVQDAWDKCERWIDRVSVPNVAADPDMPTDQLLLHFGEMNSDEIRVTRSAIRFANAQHQTEIEALQQRIDGLEHLLTDVRDFIVFEAEAQGLPKLSINPKLWLRINAALPNPPTEDV